MSIKTTYVQGSPKKIAQASKYWEVSRRKITSSDKDWQDFWKFSSQIYKHNFTLKATAFVQNTNCTHLADFDMWQKFKRYVKRGENSIAAFDISNKNKLMYVFDISQTYGQYEPFNAVLNENNTKTFIEHFNNDKSFSFEKIEDVMTYLSKKILLETINAIENPEDDLFYKLQEPFFRAEVVKTIKYVLESKHLESPANYSSTLIREYAMENEYNLVALGNLVSECSEEILRDIEVFVKDHHRDQQRENNKRKLQDISTRNKPAKDKILSFLKDKTEKGQNRESQEIESISMEKQKIFPDEEDIIEAPDFTDTFISLKESDSKQISLIEMINTLSEKSSAVVENSREDIYIPLTSSNLTDTEITGSSNITYQNITEALTKGSGFEDGKYRIYDFFKSDPDIKSASDFLKDEYGIGGWSTPEYGDFVKKSMHDSKGLTFTKQTTDITEPVEIFLSWKKVAQRLDVLIKEEKYLSADQLKYFEEEFKNTEDNHTLDDADQIPDEPQQGLPPKTNYKRTGSLDDTTSFSPKKVAENNITAIKLLLQLEKDNLPPTPEEKDIMAAYRGWGGIPQIFDNKNISFSELYSELKSVLSPEEYESARASVNNAHYTDPNIIKSIYKTIESFGFKGGNVLEPSMGIGNFYSAMPEAMESQSKLFGVELDSISARISSQLHGKAQIQAKGYEDTNFIDNTMDLIIGNIPFGDYKVHDTPYNKHNLNIHDYFFAKSIDKLRPGGILAFITSKGTLDKMNPKARELFATKANFLGAVRLPNTAFKDIANTDATSDIIFMQKREELSLEPAKELWTMLDTDDNGLSYNKYFIDNPHMMLGHMEIDERRKGMYGEDSKVTTLAPKGGNLLLQLEEALSNISAVYKELEKESVQELDITSLDTSLYQPFTFNILEDQVIYVSPTSIEVSKLNKTQIERVKGFIEIRQTLNDLINAQVDRCSDEELESLQTVLNDRYDSFAKKYGPLNAKANNVFSPDDSYNLICTLEISIDGEYQKSSIFTERTINVKTLPSKVESAKEALTISVNERAAVDLEFMSGFYKKTPAEILLELKGHIFYNPKNKNYELAEEYLSGNIKEKIDFIEELLKKEQLKELPDEQLISDLTYNLENLKNALPERLSASDIGVKLGSTWIDTEDYQAFAYELLATPYRFRKIHYRNNGYGEIAIDYDNKNNIYSINSKRSDWSVKATQEYGTERMTAYEIIEDTLNLKQVTVRDSITDDEGRKKYIINKKETLLAREKQNLLKEKFVEWLWADPQRRSKYEDKYNATFNVIRPREYNGLDLTLPGMTDKITLRDHQKNAIARIIHGKNTLLGHVVGAGKSFTMIGGIMEKKRLGISNKAMLVVPNHLTGQMGEEFLRLYPTAKVLVTSKKDFEKNNRKKFISRIALGNYDAVIIGNSQFEKIKVSPERQAKLISDEIDALEILIEELESDKNSIRTSVKRIESQKKKLEVKLEKLMDDSKKDSFINFEQLGIDSLYVDEAHMYKNGSINTKMQNIAGLGSTPSQRAMDMLLKCQYIQEINKGGGVVFATGTPISNSIAEMYTMQKYLQFDTLNQMGISHFDQWAAAFGEVTSSLELAPEGTGYRFKNRFSKFFNLPELISLFKEVADIKTAEDLDLPRPKLIDDKYQVKLSYPSETAQMIMKDFVVRAENIRSGLVTPQEDNMLKITHEARLLGTDPRLLKGFDFDENLEDYDDSKLKQVIENTAIEYKNSTKIKGTQIIFSDIGTPSKDIFNVYDYIKKNLIEKGIPENEICFIHDAKTDKQRDDMFEEMRQGSKRIIIGSTPKMGTGTNIQDRLVALHHVDCPFRPSDIEQREGRILRQGNMNEEVNIYRYATESTFDSYLWQMVENKQKFISQIMTSKAISRNCEDIDESVLSFAEVKAIASGNPLIKEKIELDNDIAQLRILKSAHEQKKYKNQDMLTKTYPTLLSDQERILEKLKQDLQTKNENQKEDFDILIGSFSYQDKKEADQKIKEAFKNINANDRFTIGKYKGFNLVAEKEIDSLTKEIKPYIFLKGKVEHRVDISTKDDGNNIQRIDNAIKNIDKKIEKVEEKIQAYKIDIEGIKMELMKPFSKENDLLEKINRQTELNHILGLDKEEVSIAIDEAEENTNTSIHITLDEKCKEETINKGIEYEINKHTTIENTFKEDSFPFPFHSSEIAEQY